MYQNPLYLIRKLATLYLDSLTLDITTSGFESDIFTGFRNKTTLKELHVGTTMSRYYIICAVILTYGSSYCMQQFPSSVQILHIHTELIAKDWYDGKTVRSFVNGIRFSWCY